MSDLGRNTCSTEKWENRAIKWHIYCFQLVHLLCSSLSVIKQKPWPVHLLNKNMKDKHWKEKKSFKLVSSQQTCFCSVEAGLGSAAIRLPLAADKHFLDVNKWAYRREARVWCCANAEHWIPAVFKNHPALLGQQHHRVLCVFGDGRGCFILNHVCWGAQRRNSFLLFLVISHCSESGAPKLTALDFLSAFVQFVQRLSVAYVMYGLTWASSATVSHVDSRKKLDLI